MVAIAPSNSLVFVAENDVNLPETGLPNKTVPSNNILTTGYDKNQTVFAEHLNYTLNNLAQWIQYSQQRVDDLVAQVEKERVSIGEIIEITGDSTNPSILKGYGTWVSFGEGQVLIGAGSHTDDRAETKVWSDGDSEGEYKHEQTEAELAQHLHSYSGTTSSDTVDVDIQIREESGSVGVASGSTLESTVTFTSDPHTHTYGGDTENTGSASPMNNIQPSLCVYRWKRVS